jgi:putative serine protease PepD
MPATIVGRDPTSDLAVVKVNVSGLPAATFANSDALQVGELVVAVGSPLGLSGTVTSGVVSALHRPVRTGDSSVTDTNAVLDAIQTDTAINPGNSGGPLVNSRGELVGINSAIATVGSGLGNQQQESGNIGVGFAIPSNQAKDAAEQIIATGKAVHPYLGVNASTNNAQGGAQTSEEGNGAAIRTLVNGGPADKAGLKEGDVVTKINGRPVSSVDGLIAAVRSYDIGSTVTITYLRDGQTRTARITLAQQP